MRQMPNARQVHRLDLQPSTGSGLVNGTFKGQITYALEHFDFAIIYFTATAPVGAGSSVEFYLQRVRDPSAATVSDDYWQDYIRFADAAPAAAVERVVYAPVPPVATAATYEIAGLVVTPSLHTIAADSIAVGHWGHALRFEYVVAGGPTTESTFRCTAQLFRGLRWV